MDGFDTLLVLGGARSGKSAFAQGQAEARAEASGLTRVFVATAQAHDEEMRVRIARHVAARGTGWRTVDAPYDLAGVLEAEAGSGRLLLVDCLTLWLSNLMLRDENVDIACADFVARVGRLAGPVVFVSNEVGSGIVPENALARRFRDAQGRLNQSMARACGAVVLVVAGLPLALKPATDPGLALRPLA